MQMLLDVKYGVRTMFEAIEDSEDIYKNVDKVDKKCTEAELVTLVATQEVDAPKKVLDADECISLRLNGDSKAVFCMEQNPTKNYDENVVEQDSLTVDEVFVAASRFTRQHILAILDTESIRSNKSSQNDDGTYTVYFNGHVFGFAPDVITARLISNALHLDPRLRARGRINEWLCTCDLDAWWRHIDINAITCLKRTC